MNIEIKENLELDSIWNNEIFQNQQQTIFLSKKFLDYHPPERFNVLNLFIFLDKKLFLIIPCVKNSEELFSHTGTTYGGIIQYFEESNEVYKKVLQELRHYLKMKNFKSITFRLPPKIFISQSINSFINSIDIFQELFTEEETYVDLTRNNFIDLKQSGYRRNHIRDIKKMESIESDLQITKVKNEKELSEYYEILENNLKKHNVKPTHSKSELIWFLDNFKNQIWIDVLKFKEKIVSGIVIFKMNDEVLHYFYGSIDYNFKQIGAIKYLYWQTMKKAQKDNFKLINFGVDSKFGEEQNHSLRSFKLGFGGLHTHRRTVRLNV